MPVFLAGAWQDEQTGGHFPAMLDDFTGSPHLYATMTNGLHTESLSPTCIARVADFLDLYVGQAGARRRRPQLRRADPGARSTGVGDLDAAAGHRLRRHDATRRRC